jgi:hypothetical protein
VKRSWFARLPLVLVILVGLGLTVAAGPLHPQTAHANINPPGNTICGTVQGYIAATPFSSGSLTLNGTTYSIAPGAVLVNDYLIAAGVPVCVTGSFNSVGQISGGTVTLASGTPTTTICGIVTVYIPATPFTPGSLVIGGVTYVIAPGAVVTGVSVTVTTAICIQVTLNSLGQIVVVSVTGVNSGTIRICGGVTGYIAPTPLTPGSITINGQNFSIAPGAIFTGYVINPGSNICIVAAVAPNLQILGGSVTPNTTFSTVVCGLVTNYIPATPSTPGTITIAGQTFSIAPGTTIVNDTLTVSGVPLCLNATFNGSGQITSGVLTTQNPTPTPSTINVCGVVTGYVAATATVAGSVGLGGTPYAIAPGVSLSGAGILTTGTSVCLTGTLNSSGQIASGTVTFNGGVQVTVCGLASLYNAPTSTMPGSLVIAGITFPVAAGATFGGTSTVQVPATLGITLTLNGQGAITAGTITATGCNGQTISGPITNYVPPTATTAGSITIAGITYPVAPGTVLTVGSGVPLSARLLAPGGRTSTIPN